MCDDDNSVLGSDKTNGNGDYFFANETWWTEHDGHDFTGTAEKAGYETGIQHIYDYQHTNYYPVNFYLEP